MKINLLSTSFRRRLRSFPGWSSFAPDLWRYFSNIPPEAGNEGKQESPSFLLEDFFTTTNGLYVFFLNNGFGLWYV